MPSQSYVHFRDIAGSRIPWETRDRGWQHSPRVGGKLVLQSNPYSDARTQMLYYGGDTWIGIPSGVPSIAGYREFSDALYTAEQQSYARLRGKLYQGSAALGISLATYKQSREMIVNRYGTIRKSVAELYAVAHRSRRAGRDVSGLILEGIFGWQPLVVDIYNACMRVIQDAPSGGFVSGFGMAEIRILESESAPGYAYSFGANGTVTHKRTATYTVSNPNKWLAERAGLLNPAAVAWDLVPWSFAVNMITNVGSLVNSITDFAGLDFQPGSLTETVRYQTHAERAIWGDGFNYRALSGGNRSTKTRIVGNSVQPPPWTLQFRIPEANWTTAAIAASLATQKISKLVSFIFPKTWRPYTE